MRRLSILLLLVSAMPASAQWGAGGARFYWSKQGSAAMTDSIRFIQGTNVTLTQTNNTLTIAASGTSASSIDSTHIVNLAVAATDLVNASILNAKIAPSAVDSTKIKPSNVTSTDIKDAEVLTADVANSAITPAKVSQSSTFNLTSTSNTFRALASQVDTLRLQGPSVLRSAKDTVVVRNNAGAVTQRFYTGASPSDGQILKFVASSKRWNFTSDSTGAASGWTDLGTNVALSTRTDSVTVGVINSGARAHFSSSSTGIALKTLSAGNSNTSQAFRATSNDGTDGIAVFGDGWVSINGGSGSIATPTTRQLQLSGVTSGFEGMLVANANNDLTASYHSSGIAVAGTTGNYQILNNVSGGLVRIMAPSTGVAVGATNNVAIGGGSINGDGGSTVTFVNATAPTSTSASDQSVLYADEINSGTNTQLYTLDEDDIRSCLSNYSASLYMTDASNAITIGSANTWVKVTGFTNETSPAARGITSVADSFTVAANPGEYVIQFNVCFTGTAADVVKFAIMDNQTVNAKYQGQTTLLLNGSANISITGRYTASLNDDFSVVVRNTNANNITITQANLVIQRAD